MHGKARVAGFVIAEWPPVLYEGFAPLKLTFEASISGLCLCARCSDLSVVAFLGILCGHIEVLRQVVFSNLSIDSDLRLCLVLLLFAF